MIERIVLEVESGILVPILILRPMPSSNRAPVVIGLAQTGKAGFLRERGGELRQLIAGGAVVVLPDLRGTGETRAGDADISTNLQLFGETLLGERLRDLRSVIAHLRGRPEIDIERLALWGESFSPVNPRATDFKTPRNVDGWPTGPEPLGGLLALLGALFEDDVAAVAVAGGLASYHSVLTHFAVLIPHGASVPGASTVGDLCDIAGVLTPMPLRLEGLVDHLNRTVSETDLTSIYEGTVRDYSNAREALKIKESRSSASQWLLEQFRRQP